MDNGWVPDQDRIRKLEENATTLAEALDQIDELLQAFHVRIESEDQVWHEDVVELYL